MKFIEFKAQIRDYFTGTGIANRINNLYVHNNEFPDDFSDSLSKKQKIRNFLVYNVYKGGNLLYGNLLPNMVLGLCVYDAITSNSLNLKPLLLGELCRNFCQIGMESVINLEWNRIKYNAKKLKDSNLENIIKSINTEELRKINEENKKRGKWFNNLDFNHGDDWKLNS
jgi:hypothetical protein